MTNHVDIETRIQDFISGCQDILNDHSKEWYPSVTPETITASERKSNQMFVRITRVGENDEYGGSAHCFVAMVSGQNKKLGAWQAGDVFKCDGWKGPARGVRGNLYDDHNGLGRMGPHGPGYNR